jgi:DNA-binding SARP family transcriptional activator
MTEVAPKVQTIDLRVLGPLEVRAADTPLPLGPRKQQSVLAVLTVHAGQVVGLAELIDELWPDSPPMSAVANVRSYAASVRRMFEAVEGRRDRLVRRGSGYQLNVESGQLDLLDFSSTCVAARKARHSGDMTAAAAQFAKALTYWRGPIVAGLPQGPTLTARAAVLTEERLSITEEVAAVYLALARPGEAVRVLHQHVHVQPLRERASALLMRALYGIGDVAGALSVYADARAALVDQLGVEPGRELQDLHHSILNRDLEPLATEIANRRQSATGSHSAGSAPRIIRAGPKGCPRC